MRRRFTSLSAALCLLVLLAGCGGAAAPAPASPPAAPAAAPPKPAAAKPLTPVSFAMAWIPSPNLIIFYLAKDRGYYKDQGLDVKLIPGKGAAISAQQVAAGQSDIGQTDLNVLALTRDKGAKIKSFMVQFPKSSFGVFTDSKQGIKTWQDLYGKKVLVSAGSPEMFLLPATFHKLGLDINRVTLLNTSAATKIPDYMAGQGDAMSSDLGGYAPAVTAKRPSNLLWFGDVLNLPYLGMFAREDYMQAHPDVVRGFTAATVKAMEALRDDPNAPKEATDDTINDNAGMGLNADQFVKSWELYKGFLASPATQGHPLGWQSAQEWQDTLQVLHDYAGLQGSMNPSDYFTNEYLPQS